MNAEPEKKIATLQGLTKFTARRWLEFVSKISGETFFLASLSEAELSKYETAILSKEGKVVGLEAQRRQLIALCWRDRETGERIVSDREIEQLKNVDGALTAELYDACVAHVGMKLEKKD